MFYSSMNNVYTLFSYEIIIKIFNIIKFWVEQELYRFNIISKVIKIFLRIEHNVLT